MNRLCDPGPRQQVWPGVLSVCSLAPCPRPPVSFRPRLLLAPCSVSFTEAQRRAHQPHRAVCVQGLLTCQRGLSVLARVHHHVLSSDLGTHCPCVVIAPDSAAHHGHRLSACRGIVCQIHVSLRALKSIDCQGQTKIILQRGSTPGLLHPPLLLCTACTTPPLPRERSYRSHYAGGKKPANRLRVRGSKARQLAGAVWHLSPHAEPLG